MLEVEYKAKVADLDAARARLDAIGAVFVQEATETDQYYDHPMRSFATTDEALRVRTSDSDALRRITYKGPKDSAAVRVRQKLEMTVEGDVAAILEALSFRHTDTVRKKRALYRSGDLTITLDEVEGLGTYMEVEGLAADAGAAAGVRQQVQGLVERLGLGPEERRSYLEMVLERP